MGFGFLIGRAKFLDSRFGEGTVAIKNFKFTFFQYLQSLLKINSLSFPFFLFLAKNPCR